MGSLAKAGPWLVKQLPQLWPLLLDAKNRERLEQSAKDLASRSPAKRLRAKVELTATLADRMAETAASESEKRQAQEWSRRAQNLLLRLEMPVAGREARRTHGKSVQKQLEGLQSEIDLHLRSWPHAGPGGAISDGADPDPAGQ